MKRPIALVFLAVLELGLIPGCGPQPPPVHTVPVSRRFLKTSTEAPAEDRGPSTEKPER